MSKNTIVHIDMGGSRISALAGVVLNDELKILGEQSRPSDDVKSGIVEKMTGAAYKINETTKLLQNALRIEPIASVSITVNAKSMKQIPYTQKTTLRKPISEGMLKKLKEECKEEFKNDKTDVIDCIPLAYYLDGKRIEDPVGQKGYNFRIDYNLIVCHPLVIENIERSIERTGLAVDYIHLGMEAQATAVLEEDDRDNGCAILSFGSTTTSLAVYCEGHLQELMVVPLGGYNITKDIEELGMSFANAETLKCKIGCALEELVVKPVNVQIPHVNPNNDQIVISTKFLSTIIESRLDEILEPIFEKLEQVAFPLQTGIILTGGASKLKNLSDYITNRTGFPVRLGSHAEWLSADTDPKFKDPVYSQAVGAILLTDYLKKQKGEEEKVIKPRIPSKNLIIKATAIFKNKMTDLFDYDEMDRDQNDQ